MKRYILRLICMVILASLTVVCEACRFTVREIGFSVLSQTTYTLVVVDGQLTIQHPVVQELRRSAKVSNIKFLLLHPEQDANHPLLQRAKEQGITFPNAFLMGPEEWMKPVAITPDYSIEQAKKLFYAQVLRSPLRTQFLKDVDRTFAYVISIPGKDAQQNLQAQKQIEEACKNVKDIMPIMPKQVECPPQILPMKADDFAKERFLLWSLGFQTLPEEPYAVVIYGRGRFMGLPLNKKQIEEGLVYNYLAMIGADCECNLDRKWMLGTQIPLYWNESTRQQLADCLTFDVDNPSILAEMSRIMAKETIGENASGVHFAPETINLDEAFGTVNEAKKKEATVEVQEDSMVSYILWGTLVVILFIAVGVSFFIIQRRNND